MFLRFVPSALQAIFVDQLQLCTYTHLNKPTHSPV